MEHEQVPYIVYEGAEARAERHIKRLIVALVLPALDELLDAVQV